MAEYDARTDAAFARLVSTLLANAAQLLLGQLDEALAERELLWRNVLSGTEDAMQDLPSPSLRTMVKETTNIPGAQALEDPGSHHRLRGHGCPSGAASDERE